MQISLTNLQDAIEIQRRRVIEARTQIRHDETILRALIEELERRLSPENRFDFIEFLKFAHEKDPEIAHKLEAATIKSFDQKGFVVEVDKQDLAFWKIVKLPVENVIAEWAGVRVEMKIEKKFND